MGENATKVWHILFAIDPNIGAGDKKLERKKGPEKAKKKKM